MRLPDRFHPGRRRPVEIPPSLLDARAADGLSAAKDGGVAPDLTKKVMGRLGYMQAAPAAAARRRRQRWTSRLLMVCAIGLFGVGVLTVAPRLPGARGPEATTMPAAVGQSIGQHQEQADRTLELIRGLFNESAIETSTDETTDREPDGPSDEIAPDVDRSAIAEVRWL